MYVMQYEKEKKRLYEIMLYGGAIGLKIKLNWRWLAGACDEDELQTTVDEDTFFYLYIIILFKRN